MFELKEIARATSAKVIRKSGRNLLKGISTDSRTIKKGNVFFALAGKSFDGHDFITDAVKKGAQAVVISKDIRNIKQKINILKTKDTAIALARLAAHHRKDKNIPLIAITGSAGKTTTKDIVAHILEKKYKVLKNFGTHNNYIGVPQTLFKLNSRHNICILELGTNHFGEISYLSKIAHPQVAIITNIGASHLEFLKDLKGVFKEKKSIINHLKDPKIVLLNSDDSFLRKIKLPKKYKLFCFGMETDCDFKASDVSLENNKINFIFNKKHRFTLHTPGRFNIYNALAGIGCGLIFGLSIKKIKEALDNFQFLEGRLNEIDCSEFCILDDTYNSNPFSLKKAIESLMEFKAKGRRILIMGDMLELGSQSAELHKKMGKFIAQKPIDMFVTLGRLSKFAAEAVRTESKGHKNIFTFDSKLDLIGFLKSKIKQGDILLIKGSRLMQMEDIVSSLAKLK